MSAQQPGEGAIRNSNGPMLMAAVSSGRCGTYLIGNARDEPDQLREKIPAGLSQADVMILSGGVSAGKLDLVPGILEEQG